MMTTESMLKQFEELTKKMVEVVTAKNKDYSRGESPFKNLARHGTYGIVVRMDDKICRLDSLTSPKYGGEPAIKTESIEDTALDLAVYSLLLILLHRDS